MYLQPICEGQALLRPGPGHHVSNHTSVVPRRLFAVVNPVRDSVQAHGRGSLRSQSDLESDPLFRVRDSAVGPESLGTTYSKKRPGRARIVKPEA